jgi:hypothetical protein
VIFKGSLSYLLTAKENVNNIYFELTGPIYLLTLQRDFPGSIIQNSDKIVKGSQN